MKKSLKHMLLSLFLMGSLTLHLQAQIKVYTMNGCGRCTGAVSYLKANNIPFEEFNTTSSPQNNTEMWQLLEGKATGTISMPVINNNGEVAFSIKDLNGYLEKIPKNGGKVNTDKSITIFQHSNYLGKSQQLALGEYNTVDMSIGNDQLSSLKIPRGITVTLYTDPGFGGDVAVLTQSQSYIGDKFNDKISSLVVESSDEYVPEETPDIVTPTPTPTTTVNFKGCATGKEVVPAENEAFEKKILELVNIERKKVGKPAMVWSPSLARAARYHAADMATDGYFEHNSYDVINGVKTVVCTTFERIGKFGKGYAENIAWGSTTPEGSINQWMNSAGHKVNILSDNKALGVGFYKNYWVQVFGTE